MRVLYVKEIANWKNCDRRTRGCNAAKPHDFEKHASQDHQPRERERERTWSLSRYSGCELGQLMVTVKCTVLSRYTGTVLAVHCHHG